MGNSETGGSSGGSEAGSGSTETGNNTETGETEGFGAGSSETESVSTTESSEAASSETENTGAADSETERTDTESGETENAGTESSETESAGTESSGTESSETESAGTESSGTESGTTEVKTEEETAAQNKMNAAAAGLATDLSDEITVSPAVAGDGTPVITVSAEGVSFDGNMPSDAITCGEGETFRSLTIQKAGTYVLTGGTKDAPLTNVVIAVDKNISDAVNLIWDELVIDNSAMGTSAGEDAAVFSVGKSTPHVNITLKGMSVLTENGSYTDSPAAIISAGDTGTVLTFTAYGEEETDGLTVLDAMDSAADYGEHDPADGICAKGTLVLGSGNFYITSNGECLKGTGKNGAGGVYINGGTYTLRSNLGGAIKSKNGVVAVKSGTVQSVYTAGDAISVQNYGVYITGGQVAIDNCYGDGIQGETVFISGEETVIDIKTYFENAGINYYNTALGSGNYNTLTTGNTTKTEVVNVDTGSHKGIKGGTKACTYSYQSVEEGSKYEAGQTYTKEASGGIVITGGTINVDTTNTGIKYNGSMGGGQGRPGAQGGNSSGSGNLSAANSDGQYIIGAPDDAIHSNHTCLITGGTITIASADDGITAPESLMVMNGCDITVKQCYEGMEAGEIIIGASDGAKETPSVKIYSNDDGVNAASDASVVYVYADESEERYTKTRTSAGHNIFQMLDGYLNVMIGDDASHSFSLPTESGTATTGTYTSDGDGIDCNGSFYAYGGTIVVYGSNSGSNSPIDTDDTYYIGSGVTLLAAGGLGMTETPDQTEQAVLTYPASAGSGSSTRPGQSMGGSASSVSANTAFAILNTDGKVVLAIKPIKAYSYLLYSAPGLKSGDSYQLYKGGSVIGSNICADNAAYDYRYTAYSTSGATTLGTLTAR